MTFREFFDFNNKEKEMMTANTGVADHQRLLAGTNTKRKKPYLVAKYLTKKKHFHPKVTLCMKTRKRIPLTSAEADQIKSKYGVCPIPGEAKKAIKQTGVHIVLVKTNPEIHILTFEGPNNGTSKIS